MKAYNSNVMSLKPSRGDGLKQHRSFSPEVNAKLQQLALGLKQKLGSEQAVADKIGTSQATVNRWINNKDPGFSTPLAIALCRACDVRLADILEDEPPPSGKSPAPLVDIELEAVLAYHPTKWPPSVRRAAQGLAEEGVQQTRYEWESHLDRLEEALANVPRPIKR